MQSVTDMPPYSSYPCNYYGAEKAPQPVFRPPLTSDTTASPTSEYGGFQIGFKPASLPQPP